MHKFYFIILLSTLVPSFCSCGEDRSYEYEQLTERDHWMTDVMKQNYLWGDSINEDKIQWKSFFAEPESFFKTLTAFAPVSDKWSWCSIDTLSKDYHQRGYFNHTDSYGMDFVLMTDPTGATSRQYARIITVIPGSPADRCGLERGDFIGSVDDNKMSSSYTSLLVNGKSRKLIVSRLKVDDAEEAFIWTSTDTISLEKSEYVEDSPYPVCKSFKVGNQTVGYLMCDRLTSGPYEKDVESGQYSTQLDEVMRTLKSYQAENLIIDFRLCNYGVIDMANRMASYLLSSSFENQAFATTFYNSSRESENAVLYYQKDALQNGLNLENVFFITSNYTKGAAEWVIRAIQHSLGNANVYLIGTITDGQNVMTEDIPSDYYTTLHPAVAYVGDADGDYDYSSGISPDYALNELTYVQLFPYGAENETVLSFIMNELMNMY